MKKVEEEKMEKDERKIIKERREKGVMVYHYSDFNEEFDEDNLRYGIVLGAVIKDAERELEDISGFIDKSLGRIGILYNEDCRYRNFQDRSVAGLIFQPLSEQSSR